MEKTLSPLEDLWRVGTTVGIDGLEISGRIQAYFVSGNDLFAVLDLGDSGLWSEGRKVYVSSLVVHASNLRKVSR